jgi:hypothetical protein
MGYTHYWKHTGFTTDQWDAMLKFFMIMKAELESNGYRYSDQKALLLDTEISADGICINGIPGACHEDFILKKAPQDDFCKTNRKPYDVAVCAMLSYASGFLDSPLTFTSDGTDEDAEWQTAHLLLHEVIHKLVKQANARDAVKPGPQQPRSQRGQEWASFSQEVLSHVETYTVPQYGDMPNDQASGWTPEQCIESIRRYCNRYGRNSRDGQQELDLLKVAHYACICLSKHRQKANLQDMIDDGLGKISLIELVENLDAGQIEYLIGLLNEKVKV